MPIDAAADLMARRGEAPSFFAAKARLLRQRNAAAAPRRDYGRAVFTPADRDARARVESPPHYRLPYADN
jgi:hypothetical protein